MIIPTKINTYLKTQMASFRQKQQCSTSILLVNRNKYQAECLIYIFTNQSHTVATIQWFSWVPWRIFIVNSGFLENNFTLLLVTLGSLENFNPKGPFEKNETRKITREAAHLANFNTIAKLNILK